MTRPRPLPVPPDPRHQLWRAIRERLRPRPVVIRPWEPPLAPADAEHPVPTDWQWRQSLFLRWPHRVRVRLAFEAARVVLRVFERARPDERGPRQALELVAAWLAGAAVPHDDLRAARSGCLAALNDVLQRTPVPDAEADDPHAWYDACRADPAVHAALTVSATLDAVVNGTVFPALYAIELLVDTMTAGGRHTAPAVVAWWWARCRAVLPVRNLAKADIEWGDLPLPPHPSPELSPESDAAPDA